MLIRRMNVLAGALAVSSFALLTAMALTAPAPSAAAPAYGVRAAVNEDGGLRSANREDLAELSRTLSPLLRRDDSAVEVHMAADGHEWAEVPPTYYSMSVARVDADGNSASECVLNEGELKNFFVAPEATDETSAVDPQSGWEVK